MSKIYVWSMKSSLHTNYRFRGTMKKLAIQIKREFAEVMNLKKIKPLTMNKQTVWVESDPINKDSILLTGGEEMKHVNKLDSVYVLTEQELEERDETISIEFADWTTRNGIYMDVFKEWYHVPNGCSKLLAKTTKELYEIFLTTKANEILNNK